MQRPASTEYHPNYQKYFDLVKPGKFPETLQRNTTETVQLFESIPDDKHNYQYAEGKWTIKEVLQHIIDTERVFSYRGLAAARAGSGRPPVAAGSGGVRPGGTSMTRCSANVASA